MKLPAIRAPFVPHHTEVGGDERPLVNRAALGAFCSSGEGGGKRVLPEVQAAEEKNRRNPEHLHPQGKDRLPVGCAEAAEVAGGEEDREVEKEVQNHRAEDAPAESAVQEAHEESLGDEAAELVEGQGGELRNECRAIREKPQLADAEAQPDRDDKRDEVGRSCAP